MAKTYLIIMTIIIFLVCSFDIFDSCKKINKIINKNAETVQIFRTGK